jgi:hypothetical protein
MHHAARKSDKRDSDALATKHLTPRLRSITAAAERVSLWLLEHCPDDWWGTVPVELVVQDGEVVLVKITGAVETIKNTIA